MSFSSTAPTASEGPSPSASLGDVLGDYNQVRGSRLLQVAPPGGVIVDVVTYCNLVPGVEYVVEAAVVDGAGPWPLFRLILFPLTVAARRTIVLAILLGSFRAFEVVYLSTGGGPSGRTEIDGTYLYNFATSGLNVGYVASASVVVLLIALALSLVNLGLQKRSESRSGA